MLGKINEELDLIQRNELRAHIEKIKKALGLAVKIDDDVYELSTTDMIERDNAVSSLNEISDFLGIECI